MLHPWDGSVEHYETIVDIALPAVGYQDCPLTNTLTPLVKVKVVFDSVDTLVLVDLVLRTCLVSALTEIVETPHARTLQDLPMALSISEV